MRITRNALNFRIIVRRVGTGAEPFQWEVRNADIVTPVSASAKRFRGMEAAYKDGQAWLADFLTKSLAASLPKRGRPTKIAQASAVAVMHDEDADDEFDVDPTPATVTVGNDEEEARSAA